MKIANRVAALGWIAKATPLHKLQLYLASGAVSSRLGPGDSFGGSRYTRLRRGAVMTINRPRQYPESFSRLELIVPMADWRELYPFPSQFIELANGVKMHYVQTGANQDDANADRPTVLCVHGNPTWSFTYRRILTDLSSDVRVIAVDHVGCGLSDKPQQYPYSLEQHIANLLQLIEKLDLRRITLLVHDWGGAIGLGAGLRVLERVEGAVILNTAAFPPPYVPLRIAACRIPILGNWAMRQLNVFARAALTMTVNRLPRLDPAVAAGLIAPYSNWNNRVAIARFVQDIPRRPSDPAWQSLTKIEEQLPRLGKYPVSLVWGMRDWCFRPECLRRFQQLLPQANVQELADVGHYVMEDAADDVIGALRRQLNL